MSQLAEFLFPSPARRSVAGIVGWWERRRAAYNLAVGSAGLVSLATLSTVALLLGGAPARSIPWGGVIAFGVLANACYLLGPAVEFLVWKVWGRGVLPVGPALYRMGLTFSVGLALLPTLLAVVWLVARVVVGVLPGA